MSDPNCRHLEVAAVLTGPDPDKDAIWICIKPQCRQQFVPQATSPLERADVMEVLKGIAAGTLEPPTREQMAATANTVLEALATLRSPQSRPEVDQ